MVGTFGYMCVLIIMKWNIDWVETFRAPSIIQTFMDLAFKMGQVDENYILISSEFQSTIQYYILITSLTCVPVMLYFKPFAIFIKSRKRISDSQKASSEGIRCWLIAGHNYLEEEPEENKDLHTNED